MTSPDNNFFKRVYQKLTGEIYKISYSQTGEDIIIDFLIGAKRIGDFTYLDIGANHPVRMNNTYKFYKAGFTGVCIEPDPNVFAVLRKKRPRDICLNVGISATEDLHANFYMMDSPLLNTFSKEVAEELQANRQSTIREIIRVPLKIVDNIIEQYFFRKAPVFINLDVEGLDEIILKNFPFNKYRPFIFCIETVHYTPDASSEKRIEVMEIMKENNYKPFADTYLNTIFIDGSL